VLLSVIVPAYNEQESIDEVLRRVPRTIDDSDLRVIVVDDGSTDGTSNIARQAGATVLSHSERLGLAAAFRTGLADALHHSADVVATLDADGQYAPEDLVSLLRHLRESNVDLVVGDRLVERCSHMPVGNRVGNIVGSAMLRLLVGLPIRDASSGLRVFTRRLGQALDITSPHTYTHEMLIQARALGFPMTNLPVSFSPRLHGESKLVRTLRAHILRSCGTILRSFFLYHPLRHFLFLATISFLVALIIIVLGIMKYSSVLVVLSFLALIFLVLGVQFVVLGILADAAASRRRLRLEHSD
jgi:glycosyltransferase involved in cell wall biosynthesis